MKTGILMGMQASGNSALFREWLRGNRPVKKVDMGK